MFGWEFPPHISGGLGTACRGLTKALGRLGEADITFVVPRLWGDEEVSNISFIGADQVPVIEKQVHFDDVPSKLKYYEIHSALVPYLGTAEYEALKDGAFVPATHFIEVDREGKVAFHGGYGFSLFQEIGYYASVAEKLAGQLDFDLIHVHDWMCFPAGIAAKKISGKPLIVHIHSTEFDRSGRSVNPAICTIEKDGLQQADRVIAVSNRTKAQVVQNYGINPRKITTIHNAVEPAILLDEPVVPFTTDRIVSFLGRVTTQKGPGYFIDAARLVTEKIKNVRFVMAGSGDLLEDMKQKVARYNLEGYFHFPGFVSDEEIEQLFAESDVFVMPSVSEPFGIVALEAMQAGVPVVVSKQSGVAEVVKNAVTVDYWDSVEMARAICRILTDRKFRNKLSIGGQKETRKLIWENSALKVMYLYRKLLL